MRQQGLVLIVLFTLFIATSLPALDSRLFRVHDFLHSARTAEMVRSLQDGQFPPVWSSNFGYGYGMPLFEFYAPLPSFFSSILVLLGVPVTVTTQLLFLVINLATILGSFYLGKLLFSNTQSGLLLASIYALAPYRAVNLFVRGAVSESWALATYPWILLGIVGIFQKKTWGVYLLIISLCSLFLSHNVSTILFLPVVLAFFILQIMLSKIVRVSPVDSKKFVLQTVFGFGVAVCISAFYLFPAYLEKTYTQVAERIAGGYFALSNHFISPRQLLTPNWGYGGSVAGIDDGLSFFVGYPQLLVLVVGAVVALRGLWLLRRSHKKLALRTLYLWFFLMMAAVSYFMTLRFSSGIWSISSVLSFTQFPWRWLGIASFFVGCVAAATLVSISSHYLKTTAVVVLLAVTIFLHREYFQPEAYLTSATEYYFDDATRIRDEMSPVLPDYLPKAFVEQPYREELIWSEDTTLVSTTQVDTSNTKQAVAVVSNPTLATLRIADFPGWQVQVDDALVPHTTSQTGLIQVPLTSGQHSIRAYFGKTPVRQVSSLVSLAGLVLVGVYGVYTRVRKVL